MKKDTLYKTVKALTPPIVFHAIKKSGIYVPIKNMLKGMTSERFTPSWHTVTKGALKGCKLFVSPTGIFKDMIDGGYDDFFSEYVSKMDLQGKTILDIGAHIGADTLVFAKSIGPKGKVIAFEPNLFNRERLEMIVAENKELSSRIEISAVAVSEKNGEEEFVFSSNVDNGTSSGSFIDGAHTFWEKEVYEKNIGFARETVKTIKLDDLQSIFDLKEQPSLVKIDVEGAEYLVIRGAKNFLKKNKPTLLIEIHSIFNMMKVYEDLHDLNYTVELLKEEKDGRCFISAKP